MSARALKVAWTRALPPTHKLVLLAIADDANGDGVVIYPVTEMAARIATKVHCSVRYVGETLRRLELDRLIWIEEAPGGDCMARVRGLE